MTPEELAAIDSRMQPFGRVVLLRAVDYRALRNGYRQEWRQRAAEGRNVRRVLGQGARALARARKQSGAA